jgi:hypothetical protein
MRFKKLSAAWRRLWPSFSLLWLQLKQIKVELEQKFAAIG